MDSSSGKMKVSIKEKAEVSTQKIEAFKENIDQGSREQSPTVKKIVSLASTVLVGITLFRRLQKKIFR